MRRALAPGWLAALAYLALAVVVLRGVARAPATLLPYPAEVERHGVLGLDRADQAFTVRAIADGAHRLVTAPWTVLDGGQCFPLARPHTLGEHLLGESLLAALPWAVTRDPIATFNAVALLSLLVPALTMFALARAWTGSAGAAFVAGLLFAFHPGRLAAISKPFIAGNAWTPLVLLYLVRLFVRGRWRDAALLALFAGLQLLASFYQVLGAALLAGAFALGLAWMRRRELPALAPKLVAVVAVVGAIAWAILAPYLATRDTWGVLQGRTPIFFYLRHFFAPHGPAYPGSIALVLAAIGLADRVRGARPRPGEDPRIAVALAGLFVVWCLSTGIPLPLGDAVVPSPLELAARWLPGLDAVRVLPLARFAWYAAVAALAAYGVVAVTERLAPRGRVVAALAIAAAAVLELQARPLARLSFLEEPVVRAHAARPADADVALYRSVPPGAVLDLPLGSASGDGAGIFATVPAMRAGAWHLQPIAACYNSFATPLQRDVEALAARLPDPRAAAALGALGFGSLLVHESLLDPGERARLEPWLRDGPGVERLAATPALGLSALPAGARVSRDLGTLAPPAGDISGTAAAEPALTLEVDPAAPPAGAAPVDVRFANGSAALWVHPEPIEPTPLEVRWRAADGTAPAGARARVLLPLALAPGEGAWRTIAVEPPRASGRYVLEVAAADAPGVVLGRRTVEIRPVARILPGS